MTAAPGDDADLRSRVARLSLEQKVRLLTGADLWALYPEPDAGLHRVVLSDGPAGVRGESWDERDTSANVPSPTALAATWDCGRVEAIGGLLAAEARRKGVDVLLAPTVNLHRTPYGGRHFECFSEDPLLTARIGAAYVRGLQNQGVGATVKHFVANDSETERMTADVRVDERTLRELYLAPFEAMLRPSGGEAGAWAVMAAYNGVNGTTMTESPLLRDILHGEWGYDGLVMSDWTATRSTVPAARAALDLAMPGPAGRFGPWGDALAEAVRAGEVDEALIDDKVLRILRLAARVGGLDGAEPGGRLPTTWPASEEGLPSTQPADGVLSYAEGLFTGYRAFDRDGREPLFPFGHGQGYTSWSYDSVTVDCGPAAPSQAPGTPGVAVCVEVRNTGARRGREVVQVYASRPDSAVERPAKWLAGFAAVDADPGEAVTVGILLPERVFQYWSDGGWTLEPGEFTLSAGSSAASLPLTGRVSLK